MSGSLQRREGHLVRVGTGKERSPAAMRQSLVT